jgi:hypothetical protein
LIFAIVTAAGSRGVRKIDNLSGKRFITTADSTRICPESNFCISFVFVEKNEESSFIPEIDNISARLNPAIP